MSRRRYRLLGRLEAGELAELYKGLRDEHESVLVKLFHPHTSAPEYARELAETSRALSGIRDVGILHEVEIGLVAERLAVVREAVDGFNLGTALQRLSTKEVLLHPPIALYVMIQLLEAVQRAHEAQVIHGAITPGNVILSKQGQVAICDFGAIRALEAAPALKPFLAKGRSAYRAVELEQAEKPTIASDIYSLGAIAYELLTMREALVGKGANVSVRRDALPPPPSRLDRRLNSRLDPIIMRALDPVPQRRFRSCIELSNALRNFLTANGGMANASDVQKFVGELFPKEVSFQLGPTPFDDAFALREVRGADLHPDVVGDVALRSSFSGGAAPDVDENTNTDEADPASKPYLGDERASRATVQVPPLDALKGVGRHDRSTVPAPVEEPSFDDGTEPGNAGPLEGGWHAPSAHVAPTARSGPKAQAAQPAAPNVRARMRSAHDFSAREQPLEAHVRDTDPNKQTVHSPPPRHRVEPSVSAPSQSTSGDSISGPVGSMRRMTTGRLMIRRMRERRRTMGLVALLVAGVGLASFVVAIRLFSAPREALAREQIRHGSGPPAQPIPHPEPPKPPPAPVHLEPTANHEQSGRPVVHGDAHLTVLSNAPAAVYMDGLKLPQHTPIHRMNVPSGARHFTIESIRTHEKHEVDLTLEPGDDRKIEEWFNLPPARR